MCGICGYIKFDGPALAEDHHIVKEMNRTLLHRGPDAQDVELIGNVAFGFSRLSIIGLDNGMQPIYNEDRSVVVICNGEIFNYIELRASLKQKGHQFSTSSDVEVLVHLYEEYGMDFLNLLNSQFAFALYDLKKQLLFCARDQMGIVPLFYTYVRNTFIFASEIKAILKHPFVSAEVDLTGLDQVFAFAGLISPRTMFKGINSLENGHYLRVDHRGKMKDVEYWDLRFPELDAAANSTTEEEYVEELTALFENSIRLRLRTDVPFGLYLSGGLDSSAIAMKVSQLMPGKASDAYSIDFCDSKHSESTYQQLIAGKSNCRLKQKLFFYNDITSRLQSVIYHCECPLKETYNAASLSLSEMVRANGIKVILSGEGADEFFAGYVGYRFDKMRTMNIIPNTATRTEMQIRDRLWGDRNFFYERNFTEFAKELRELYSSQVNASYDEISCLNYQVVNREKLHNLDLLNKRTYVDYKIRLVDHLVSDHGDRMALANSVEVRYPFLDKDIVEFSTRLPVDLKLNEFTEKYIVRKMAGRFVPKAVTEREKFHFIAPGSPYLVQKNVDFINDILSYDLIKKQGYFNPDQVERIKKQYSQKGYVVNAPYESDLLITVITFGILLDQYFS